MLSCTEISFVISFFNFEKFGVKPVFPFFFKLTLYRGPPEDQKGSELDNLIVLNNDKLSQLQVNSLK